MNQASPNFNITYRRSQRAKNLRITIEPSQAIIVTVPRNATRKQAESFVQTRQAWIKKHLAKLRQLEALKEEQPQLSHEELIKVQDDLFARLEHFSKKFDLPYRKAAFRCQKTKWGSCSGQNNISLNINIAFLPRHLQDYILLHELCHIRHKNHGKRFWSQLDQYCGTSAKTLAKELRKHPMQIRA